MDSFYEDIDSIVYYDVGAINGRSFPFSDGKNDQYIKKWIGIDPNFVEEYSIDGKNIYYGCAVSDFEGISKYYVSNREINNSLYPASKNFFKGIHGRQMVIPKSHKDIFCRRLDTIITSNGGDIDILKIDAHGSEYPILTSAQMYFEKIIIIHVEIWKSGWYEGAVGGETTYNFLIDSGFAPTVVIDIPKKSKAYADIIFLNNFFNGRKLDLCKNLYCIDDKKIRKQNDIMSYIKKELGW